ncbi:MAG: hypothetical protein QXD25_01650 [Nanopusillaceae archaeon]
MIKQKKKKEISENFLEKKFFTILEELKKRERIIDITITTKTEEKTIKKSFVAVPELKLSLQKFKTKNENFETLKRFDLIYKNIKLGNLKFYLDKRNPKNIGISIFLSPFSSKTPLLFIIPLDLLQLKRLVKKLAECLEKYKEQIKYKGRKTKIFEMLKELENKIFDISIKEVNEEELVNEELKELYEKIKNKLNELNELIKLFVQKSIEELEINNEKIQEAIKSYYFFISNGLSKEEAIQECLKIYSLSEIETKKFLNIVLEGKS